MFGRSKSSEGNTHTRHVSVSVCKTRTNKDVGTQNRVFSNDFKSVAFRFFFNIEQSNLISTNKNTHSWIGSKPANHSIFLSTKRSIHSEYRSKRQQFQLLGAVDGLVMVIVGRCQLRDHRTCGLMQMWNVFGDYNVQTCLCISMDVQL